MNTDDRKQRLVQGKERGKARDGENECTDEKSEGVVKEKESWERRKE
jgi:hypothetical protein